MSPVVHSYCFKNSVNVNAIDTMKTSKMFKEKRLKIGSKLLHFDILSNIYFMWVERENYLYSNIQRFFNINKDGTFLYLK